MLCSTDALSHAHPGDSGAALARLTLASGDRLEMPLPTAPRSNPNSEALLLLRIGGGETSSMKETERVRLRVGVSDTLRLKLERAA